ncbi:DUF389 domain-containing protein [Candidatus Halobonum tyrrellensis]|uniref:TIGR00341 family protein n=1 Tax=Candidatus Halobonum tyrrellensis G22 TaxID=1324957 RepID=V4HDE2_9EURY|nr:DUF389 domain-containing protein [Candidatus Halobonum tyrrellensis]ESP88735.1 hypothetical protein K933_07788 [Candidatus Halobonum tyrrellensis G22]
MRLVHVYVNDDERPAVERVLEDLDIDYAVVADEEDRTNLFQFPLPQGAVSEVFEALRDVDIHVEEDAYVVLSDAETALTSNIDELQERYADSYVPLPAFELQAKARSMNMETVSYLWMILLSTVIATVGLLIGSPAVVVGSMVLAPLVGPTLTASVGAVTGDGDMFTASVRQQLRGLVVAVVGAVITAFALLYAGLVPSTLAVTSLDLVTVRLSPGALGVLVGFVAGAAAAFGLTTEGPLSIIGVMIAAALVPAAGVAGIGVAYGEPLLALGTVVLLVVSILAINLGEMVTLFSLGYRELPRVVGGDDRADDDDGAAGAGDPNQGEGASGTARTVVLAVVVLLVAAPAVAATGQQVVLQRDVTTAVDETLTRDAYDDVSAVGVSAEYSYPVGFAATPIVTVSVTTTENTSSYPRLADRIQRRVYERTGRRPTVRVQFTGYQEVRGNETRWFGSTLPSVGGGASGSAGGVPA